MSSNRLKLNEEKTEIVIFKTPDFKGKLSTDRISLSDVSFNTSQSARNTGVTFDETMSMADHISAVCKSANFHLRNIGKIRKHQRCL